MKLPLLSVQGRVAVSTTLNGLRVMSGLLAGNRLAEHVLGEVHLERRLAVTQTSHEAATFGVKSFWRRVSNVGTS